MNLNLLIKDQYLLQILSEVEARVKNILNDKLVKIILYGSYARDQQGPESDIDIMLLVNYNEQEMQGLKEALNEIKFDILFKYNLVLSILVKDNQHFNNYLDVLPFYKNVYNEGIAIYG
jgi:predicted nucleotidyltransferase